MCHKEEAGNQIATDPVKNDALCKEMPEKRLVYAKKTNSDAWIVVVFLCFCSFCRLSLK